jgi:hypothetical protein
MPYSKKAILLVRFTKHLLITNLIRLDNANQKKKCTRFLSIIVMTAALITTLYATQITENSKSVD